MSDVCIPEMAPWVAATECTGGATQGARALMAYFLESTVNTRSMGIYNCRTVGGSSSLSMHSEGRADDLGVDETPEGLATGWAFLAAIAPHAKRIGLQFLIFDRTKWANHRDDCGEYYGGVSPHTDHIHAELSRLAGEQLTLATLRAVVGDFRDNPLGGEATMFVRRGDSSEVVKYWQARVIRLGEDLGEYGENEDGIDGSYGGMLTAAVINLVPTSDGMQIGWFEAEALEALIKGQDGADGLDGDDGDDGADAVIEEGTEFRMSTIFTKE